MVEITLIPTWEEVATAYPYAPGRGDLSNEEWSKLRRETRAKRKAERDLKAYDRVWAKAEKEDAKPLQYDELPGRTPWWRFDQRVENPQTGTDVTMATGAGFARPFTWLGEQAAKLFLDDEDVPDADYKAWREKYLLGAGGSDAGGDSLAAAFAGIPKLNLAGYNPNWAKLEEELGKVQAPKYQERAFNPQMAMANMLMNMDWINLDMSKAGAVMQQAFDQRAKNNADVANANAEAQTEQQKWAVARKLALEEMKANNAYKQAQIALYNYNASMPKALGGNKIAWRDSSGNMRFDQLDKQGEARTVGANLAMSDILEAGGKKLTPKQIYKKAQAAAMLYPDANKVPFINGYMLQAMQMQQGEEED